MKITYVHDLNFIKLNNSVYSSTGMPEQYFERFIDSGVNDICIISRVNQNGTSSTKGYTSFKSNKIHLSDICISNYARLFSLTFVRSLIQELKNTDFLVVNTPSIIGMFTLLINVFVKRPYSVEVAADYDQFSSKNFGFLVSLFIYPFMKFFVAKAKGATYVSEFLKNRYRCKGITLVASNVNLSKINEKESLDVAFSKESAIAIGFVGGLVKRKGLKELLDSVKILKSYGYKTIKLHIVGGHSDQDWHGLVKSLDIVDNVLFYGLCDKTDIERTLKKLDLYIQPSLTEGIPRATLEAMSYSLPVIATKLPGFREILKENVLVKPKDAKELSLKIMQMLTDKDMYNQAILDNKEMSKKFMFSCLQLKRVEFYKKVFAHR